MPRLMSYAGCRALMAALLLGLALPGVAHAKQCLRLPVTTPGESAATSAAAQDLSKAAWRDLVRKDFGGLWSEWLNSEDRRINCQPRSPDKPSEWVCVLSARPCDAIGTEARPKGAPRSTTVSSNRMSADEEAALRAADIAQAKAREKEVAAEAAANAEDLRKAREAAERRLEELKAAKTSAKKDEKAAKDQPSPPNVSAPPGRPPAAGDPADAAANICVTKSICTPVRVFFGTDRKREANAERVTFGGDRAANLQLGRAIVTVPRAVERKRGEISRPSWYERNILRVPPEGDPARHFTILKDGFSLYRSTDEFVAAVREHMAEAGTFKDHAFVFVHGYRNTFDQALYRSAQIAYDLGEDNAPFGTAFLYSWPSGGELRDYKYDSESARFTIDNLVGFLDLVIAKTGAKHVHLIAHSMGNDPLLAALDRLMLNPELKNRIGQVVLAAPDVDAREFERIAGRILPKAQGVTLFASKSE